MSKVVAENQALFSSDIGLVVVTTQIVKGYNVEDFVRRQAMSIGRRLQFVHAGNNININNPVGPRTISSAFFKSDYTPLEED